MKNRFVVVDGLRRARNFEEITKKSKIGDVKMKTKLKKFLIILMVLVTIIQITISSFAGLEKGDKINLKSNGRLDCLLQFYKDEISAWSYKVAYYIYYQDKETGKKMPAICVDRSVDGVGELGSYDTTIDICNDDGIYTILYIYNNKKYGDWGLKNNEDYYLAVQTAMHCYTDKVSPKKVYRVGEGVLAGYTPSTLNEIKTRGTAVLNTAESLYNSAIKKEYKQNNLTINLNEKSEWVEENISGKEYYSKKFEVTSNVSLDYYKIDTSDLYGNVKIFDLNNNEIKEKAQVNNNDFKIAIAKSDITSPKTIKGNIKIDSATAKIPVAVYANSNNPKKQDYVVYTDKMQQVTKTKETTLTVKNNKIFIYKLDSKTKTPLKGAEFDIYKKQTDSSGNYILNEKTFMFTTESSNSKGEITLPIEESGEYLAKEKKAPDSYALSNKIYEFSVQVGLNPKNIEIKVDNEKIKGKIEIIKISKDYNEILDIKEGTGLEGAKYKIEDSNGNLIGTYTTDAEGKILTDELEYGEYKIYEIESPKFYNLNKEPQTVFINEDGKTYTVTFENESSKVKVNVEKSGTKETEAGKTIEYEFDNLENQSNVVVDNFTWRDVLPTDAVRLEEISTGTWTEEIEYSIWYKTNLSDEDILYKEKLNSKENYKFKLNDLKLSKNEYITEFEFRFGTVNPGFKEEVNPKIYCKVLDNLKNGYEFTNNTFITATYLDKKVEDNDNWKTIIYNKETPIKKKLPKTGF